MPANTATRSRYGAALGGLRVVRRWRGGVHSLQPIAVWRLCWGDKVKRSILFAIMLGLAACDQVPISFSPAKTSNLEVGQTTYDQAVAQLGKPTDESKLPDGRRLATYTYLVQGQSVQTSSARGGVTVAHATTGPSNANTSTFQMQFDPNGVLQSYTWGPR